MNALLQTSAREINKAQETIEELKKQTEERGMSLAAEIILQGQRLIAAKEAAGHGNWLDWLKGHCPGVEPRMAQRYMNVASNTTRVSHLKDDAVSLRELLALCDAPVEKKETAPVKQWPGYVEVLARASKFIGHVERFPIQKWPEEGVKKLREDLYPVVVQLWPQIQGIANRGMTHLHD